MRKTIILVHGAWHGAWCFEKIIPLLEAKNFRVLAPDLPGHGQYHNENKIITLNDYVEAVAALVKAQDEPVILLGHSLGGMIISQVAELLPNQISQLIYLCAYIPADGESLLSIAERASLANMPPYLKINEAKQEIDLERMGVVKNVLAQLCSEADQASVASRLIPQSLQTFKDSVHLSHYFASVSKMAIICQEDKAIAAADQRRMARRSNADIVTLSADHSPFYSYPEKCASVILEKTLASCSARD